MSRRLRPYRVASAWLLVMGMASAALAQVVAPGGKAKSSESPAAAAAPVTPADNAAPPPFWVAGVVIGPAQRSAVLVVLDDKRRDVGLITLREGESYGGYRVAGVEPARVLLEQNGTVFPMPVGRPGAASTDSTGAVPLRLRGPIFIPGPDKPKPDLEYKGPQVERRQPGGGTSGLPVGGAPADPEATRDVLQRIFSNPQIQQRIEESRPKVRERLERDAAGQQPVDTGPAATSEAPPK